MGHGGRHRRGFLTRLLCVGGILCAAQAVGADVPGITNVRFHTYSTAEGLSQASAMAIAQDRTGFLWIGTQDGLDRFDGYGFKVYRHDRADPWSIADSNITALAADADGSLWVGAAADAVQHYDPILDRFVSYTPSGAGAMTFSRTAALLIDHTHRLWVAGLGAGLQWFDPATETFAPIPFGRREPLRNVRAMIEQDTSAVLIGTREGLWRSSLDAARFEEWRYDNNQSIDVEALAIAADGTVWVSSAENGLYEFSAVGRPLAHFSRAADASLVLADEEVRGLNFDQLGRLWIATKNSGLARLDAERSHISVFAYDPARPQGIGAARQQTVFVDRDGLVWAGSWVNGVSVHDPRTEAFSTISRVPGDARTLPGQSVSAVTANADGSLWLGLSDGGGLVRFDPANGIVAREVHEANVPGSLPQGLVRDVLRAHDGGLWVATASGGIGHRAADSKNYVPFRHSAADPASLASDNILQLMEDETGTLWIATEDAGVDELCAGCGQFRHHRHDPANPDSIGGDVVVDFLRTRDGDFWVGLRSGGLDRFDLVHDRFEHFRADASDPESLSHNSVSSMLEDSSGVLWIGTSGGLNRLRPGSRAAPRFDAFTRKEGLASEVIGGVVEDAAHKMWISTIAGISRLDPITREVLNFGSREGALQQGYFVDVRALLPDGRIVFGGLSGATLFDPQAVKPPSQPVPVITEVLLNNVPVELRWRNKASPLAGNPWVENSAVTFNHRQNNVSFAFAALGFGDPETVNFSYKLEGHDTQWIQASEVRRYATYTDLPPGEYTLRVRARNAGAAWAENGASLNVSVLPAPWLSPLAYFLYSLLAAFLAAIAGRRLRSNWRRERQAQETIRLSEQRLKYALWGSGGELWDLDMRTGAVLRDNRMDAVALTHEARSQTLDGFRSFVHPEDLAEINVAFAKHLRGENDVFEVSYRTIDKDHREWRWVITRGSVTERDPNGRAIRVVGTTQDITELKQTEESLRRLNEELEVRVEKRTVALSNANTDLRRALEQLKLTQSHLIESEKMAALGSLVAGIAHEINTPLGVAVTAASHLDQETSRLLRVLVRGSKVMTIEELREFDATVHETVDMILRNLRRADQLVKSFKLVAVDQSNEEAREIEIGAYLDDVLTSMGPMLRKAQHSVRLDCARPLLVVTYPGALYQIVSNLVMNAVMHAFDGGQSGAIVVSASVTDDRFVLSCSDNGKGMADSVRTQIFEPFFTTRRGQGGSGLGLHVVYNLVTQLLKGTIRVDSAPGQGARFEISLPLGRADGEPAAPGVFSRVGS